MRLKPRDAFVGTLAASLAIPSHVLAITSGAVIPRNVLKLAREPCPAKCSEAGNNPANWTIYHDITRLERCSDTILLDFTIHNPLNDGKGHKILRSCTADLAPISDDAVSAKSSGLSCIQAKSQTKVEAPLQLAWLDSTSSSHASDAIAAVEQVRIFLAQKNAHCDSTMSFAHSNSTVVGVYAGSEIQNQGLSEVVLQQFVDELQENGISKSVLVQLCGVDDRGSDYAFGAVADATSDLAAVQNAVKAWSSGRCVTEYNNTSPWKSISMSVPAPIPANSTSVFGVTKVASSLKPRADCAAIQVVSGDSCASLAAKCGISGADFTKYNPNPSLCPTLIPGEFVCCSAGTLPNRSLEATDAAASSVKPRADCAAIQAVSGDSCASLAAKCGISGADFTKYNPNPSLCSTLVIGESVCCSAGTLPSRSLGETSVARSLRPRADCVALRVVSGDGCASLAAKCGVSAADFTKYNPSSTLCSSLIPGQYVCCTAGTLPDRTPKPNPDGSCATYTVNTGDTCSSIAATYSLTADALDKFNKQTFGWTGCDNIQPGLMCISTGTAPMPDQWSNAVCGPRVVGTKPPTDGTNVTDLNPCPLNACCDVWAQCGITSDFCTLGGPNGCISNCGSDIVSGDPPTDFRLIGYFEAFNSQQECMIVDIADVDVSQYTHIHFAFATITDDFNVNVTGVGDQYDKFVALKDVKRVLSFGGWSFSTDQDTYPIFREGVTPENRDTFISNLVAALQGDSIDGVDFDWEYPGATDIPSAPGGSPNDSANYLAFLKALRSALDAAGSKDITISIAAPASYWYLQNFPIKDMSDVVDYIVYMTYDLHGQWDYSNAYADPGCKDGNCLRSHINYTETLSSLSMITKAGVPSNKVVVGVSSYGRSFEMTTPGCYGEMCTYTGPESGATAGICTNTPGYISNAEIALIISDNTSVTYVENDYKDGSFSNLLVYDDTQWVSYMDPINKELRKIKYTELNMGGTTDWAIDLSETPTPDDEAGFQDINCENTYTSLDDLIADTSVPDACMNQYIADALDSELNTALSSYQDILNDGYDDKFKVYDKYVRDSIPAALEDFYEYHTSEYFTCTFNVRDPGSSTVYNYTASNGGCPPDTVPNNLAYYIYVLPIDPTYEAFYKFMESKYGVDRSFLIMGTKDYTPCHLEGTSQTCSTEGEMVGYPIQDPNMDVPNPKDVISKSLTNLTILNGYLSSSVIQSSYDLFSTDMSDVVDSSGLMINMAASAVTSMQKVADLGEKIDAEKKKNMILNFVMGFLMIIPFVGEALDAIGGAAMIARMIALTGDIGNAAMTVYGVVEDPSTAPLAIFGFLLGGIASKEEESITKAARMRRDISDTNIGKLGDDIKAGLGKIEKVIKRCG